MVPKLAALNIERRRSKFSPFGRHLAGWHENKLRIRINELPDEPRARHSVHFHLLSRNPFHNSIFSDPGTVGVWPKASPVTLFDDFTRESK